MAPLYLTAAVLLGDAGHHALSTFLWFVCGLRVLQCVAIAWRSA